MLEPFDSISDSGVTDLGAHSELALIVATAAEIHGHLSIGLVLQAVTEKILPALHADEASVMLLDRSTRQLRCVAASGQGLELIQDASIELGEGIAGHVALDGRAMVLTEGEIDQRFSAMLRSTRGIYSAMCIPLIAVRETVGVLNISRSRTRVPFTAADLESARLFGVHLAITIRRLQHLRLLERRLEGLGMAHRMRGRFLCALNHEIRTPLTVILGFTDILASREGIEAEDREMIMQIELLVRIAPPVGSIHVATGGSDGHAWITIRPAADASALTDAVNEMNDAPGDRYIRSPASMEWVLLMILDVVEAHDGQLTVAADGTLRMSVPCGDVPWERF